MFDVRRVSGDEITKEELKVLVDIYKTCFGEMVSEEGKELDALAQHEVSLLLKPSPNIERIPIVAYDGVVPVGFLFAHSLVYHGRTISMHLVDFHRSEKIEDKDDHWSALTLSITGLMARGKVYANPRECLDGLRFFLLGDKYRRLPEVRREDIDKSATAVSSLYRGQGIGGLMNIELERIARERGAKSIFTTCTENPSIHRVNERAGYIPLLRVEPYYADGSPGTFMVKNL